MAKYNRYDYATAIPQLEKNVYEQEENIAEQSRRVDTLEMQMSGLLDFFYPVGSYYETSDDDFDPNVSWGGTWTKTDTRGRVTVASGTWGGADSKEYVIGDRGGTRQQILPQHNHSLTRSTNVAVDAHEITQPTFTYPDHNHAMGNRWSSGSGGSSNAYMQTANRVLQTIYTTPKDGGGSCTRTTNVALTNNHKVTQPVFTCGNEGVPEGDEYAILNGNMQPYIVVNRWHRTA